MVLCQPGRHMKKLHPFFVVLYSCMIDSAEAQIPILFNTCVRGPRAPGVGSLTFHSAKQQKKTKTLGDSLGKRPISRRSMFQGFFRHSSMDHPKL